VVWGGRNQWEGGRSRHGWTRVEGLRGGKAGAGGAVVGRWRGHVGERPRGRGGEVNLGESERTEGEGEGEVLLKKKKREREKPRRAEICLPLRGSGDRCGVAHAACACRCLHWPRRKPWPALSHHPPGRRGEDSLEAGGARTPTRRRGHASR
jgi:hypothetical protein